jgi:hypothetical protein
MTTTTDAVATDNPADASTCEACESGCSCEGGVDPECGHFGCWGIPNDAPRCAAYEAQRRETYAALGLPCPEGDRHH